MENKGKGSMIQDAAALFLITLVAGLCLGFVYQITKEPILRAEAAAKQRAYEKVFPDAQFQENPEINAKVEASQLDGMEVSEVMEARDGNDAVAGYVMTIISSEGYGGDIKLSLGMKADGTITGMEILSMSETAGLGAKCTEDGFKSQFSGIRANEIIYSKTGKSEENQIDAISGATITTKAVTNAVNGGIDFMRDNVLAEQ